MIPRSALAAASGILLAAATAGAQALPYVTVTLDGFERARIHDRAVSLMRTEVVYDDMGNFVSADTDVFRFDDLRLRQLTTDGGSKAAFTIKSSSRYVAWAQFGPTGPDIMAYDLKRRTVLNVSRSPAGVDPFFDLEDNRFAWKVLDGSEYDFVFSDGRRNTVVNEAVNDEYPLVFGDPQTSGRNAAFSAAGTDPQDGSTDTEVFFFDGRRLHQVTDDPAGYNDDITLVSGDQVVFVTTHPEQDAEPYQLRVYDGRKKRVRTVLLGGSSIVGGHVLNDDFCFPIEFSDDLLIWNGSIVGSGPVLLLTNVRTGETQLLDDVTGGSVFVAGTADGYVAMFSESSGGIDVVVYRPRTGELSTAATHGVGFTHSGLLSISGPNVAYNYFEGDTAKVAVHYRADDYAKELRRSGVPSTTP